jgi:hypothetical protein
LNNYFKKSWKEPIPKSQTHWFPHL